MHACAREVDQGPLGLQTGFEVAFDRLWCGAGALSVTQPRHCKATRGSPALPCNGVHRAWGKGWPRMEVLGGVSDLATYSLQCCISLPWESAGTGFTFMRSCHGLRYKDMEQRQRPPCHLLEECEQGWQVWLWLEPFIRPHRSPCPHLPGDYQAAQRQQQQQFRQGAGCWWSLPCSLGRPVQSNPEHRSDVVPAQRLSQSLLQVSSR